LYYIDYGSFFEFQENKRPPHLLNWSEVEHREDIKAKLYSGLYLNFTFVRNPYRRLLSAFADKIFGYQRHGGRYRGGTIHSQLMKYGVKFGPKSNIFSNFRGFVHFAADTIREGQPMLADIHWQPCAAHLRATMKANHAWQPHFVGHVEDLQNGLNRLAALAGLPPSKVPAKLPRENSTSLPPMHIRRFYGNEEIDLVRHVYAVDFEAFGYGDDPEDTTPQRPNDLSRIAPDRGTA
jgi:hypothetical protein